jgi:hypothetical protein
MYQGDAKLGEIGRSFTDLVNALERTQVEYDLASEDTIARLGKVDGKKFFINLGEYDLVILPPNMENLNIATAELLMEYVLNGGRLLYAELPTRCDGVELFSEAVMLKELAELPNAQKVSPAEAVATAKKRTEETGLSVIVPEGTRSIFHHRRTLPDCEVLFICNADQEKTVDVDVNIFSSKKFVSAWSLEDGKVFQGHQCPTGGFTCPLAPSGSALFILSDAAIPGEVDSIVGKREYVTLPGSDIIFGKRLEPNVLTLDFVDVKVGDEERKDVYTWEANRWVYQKHGFPAGNPWDNQVQFEDELITMKFPERSGFEATYRFVVDGDTVTGSLAIVIERPDLYSVYCNDKLIREPGTMSPNWWLDRSFGKIDISKVAKVGENVIKIVAHQLTIEHELEPAYLLGNFSLLPADKGFTVCTPQPLRLKTEPIAAEERHSDELEGVSWLSAGVGFRPNRPDLVDRAPMLTFEFAEEQPIAVMKIWNYNERNLQKRGIKSVEITGLGPEFKKDLPLGNGSALTVAFGQPNNLCKKIEFKILSNHAGVTYPIPEGAQLDDNGFVGLSEVQFLMWDDGQKELVPIPAKNVTVKASSELVVDSHDRRARYLVDGSGLGGGRDAQGWHMQGMPFYSDKVEYSRSFEVAKVEGTYSVKLPESPTGWYGATARVFVNGNEAGYVVSAPWTADVTKFVKQGINEVSVQVYGTPKNLLGPHHVGKMRGQAWPNAFQRGPEHQPPGSAYDVIGYGLFETFELMQAVIP